MAAIKGAMANLPASQLLFGQVEEPEQNRINFRDSLKFFQEQLIINGGNLKSASDCRLNEDLGKCTTHSVTSENSEEMKNDLKGLKEIQKPSRCRIQIPTVDTILESVRVLRAIQKSQQERGSSWSIDITSQTDLDTDFQLTDEWTHLRNGHHEFLYNEETNYNGNSVEVFPDKNSLLKYQDNISVVEADDCLKSYSNNVNENCEFWPRNTLSPNKQRNTVTELSNSDDVKDVSDWKEKSAQGDDTNYSNESNVPLNQHLSNEDKINLHNQNTLHHICNETDAVENSCNEKCPFWPGNTLYIKEKSTISELSGSNGDRNTNDKDEYLIDNINYINESNASFNQQVLRKSENEDDTKNLQNIYGEIGVESSACFKQYDFQNAEDSKADERVVTSPGENGVKDLVDITRKDILTYTDKNIVDFQENITEIFERSFKSSTEFLKIETYDENVTQKCDFLLPQSIWKGDSSANENSSIKMESNDNDSGIGTQRSASSLSPNNPSQMQKDCWSDTCSSHYASAECSPYHSLNSIFEPSREISSPASAKSEADSSTHIPSGDWEESENSTENIPGSHISISPVCTNFEKKSEIVSNQFESVDGNALSKISTCKTEHGNDTLISNCVTNLTLENVISTEQLNTKIGSALDIYDNSDNELKTVDYTVENYNSSETLIQSIEQIQINGEEKEESPQPSRAPKFTVSPSDLVSIVKLLYTIKENPAYQIVPITESETFEEVLFILSRGAFYNYPEDKYLVKIKDSVLYIEMESELLLSLSTKYAEVSMESNSILKIDNKMGRCLYIRCDLESMDLKAKLEYHCIKHWQTDCLQLVHYPLKCHQNVVIVDLGSVSTRAGILMDQPTLPNLFFPTVCATDKTTGKSVYGMEALQPEVRKNSNLSFPVRPSIKITKHTIDINSLEGLFKKIFTDLKISPNEYTVQVCLPRNLSINAQNDLVKLMLETLKVKSVSLTNQSLLTLYAHDVSTAIVVDIGDRTDVLPVVDGFIVENGVSRLPYGGQRLIHHMKHSLAEKHISLSTEIDSFVVQYVIENLAYVAEDFNKEIQMSLIHPEVVRKTVMLQPVTEQMNRSITLDEARFAVTEGLFNPEMWGLDSPGIHNLVQKAIQATSVDVRKQIAENIYVSGGVTMLPGFIERLNKEVAKLSKAKIIPKVFASNYRYHCTYIGACKFAKLHVFPNVCVSLEEYNENNFSALKKFALY